ncbi:hypothetical protein [Spirosoma horti]
MLSRLQLISAALNPPSIGWLLFLLMGVARLTQAQCPKDNQEGGLQAMQSSIKA